MEKREIAYLAKSIRGQQHTGLPPPNFRIFHDSDNFAFYNFVELECRILLFFASVSFICLLPVGCRLLPPADIAMFDSMSGYRLING